MRALTGSSTAMPNRSRKQLPQAHDIAAEVVRRTTGPDGIKAYVVRLSEPPTVGERLQLIAARLERRPIVVMPHKRASTDEWMARYSELKDR
jgi:hypothetical protein